MNQRQLHVSLIINFRWNGKFVQMDLIFSCDGCEWLMLMVYCIIYFVMYITVFIAVGSCNSRSYLRLPYLCYRRWTWPTSTSNGIHRRYPINTRMRKDRFSGINVVSGVCVCVGAGASLYVTVTSILWSDIRPSFTLTGYFVSNSYQFLCRVGVQRSFTNQSIHRHELNIACVLS